MKIFKEVINPAFHSISHGLATQVFGTTPPVNILDNLQRLYGKTSYQELDAALLRLNEQIKWMQPVEVMIIVIEEVQLFLLANTDREGSLTEPNIMS